MATITSRLHTLELTQRRTRPALVIFLHAEQESRPTEAQAALIAQAERHGREVTIIAIRRSEDLFPGFTALPR